MKIYKTSDYTIFKRIKGNREIDRGHLKKIINSISERNMLAEHPIVVNNVLKILDGQHRLMAAETLGLDVYYTVVDKGGLEEVIALNNAQKNWTLYDFLDSYIAQGNGNYVVLKDFITQYNLPISVAIDILSGKQAHRAMDSFRDGKFEVTHEKQAYEIGQMLVEYRRYSDSSIYRSKDFIRAVEYMYHKKPVPHFQMIEKLVKTGRRIERQQSTKEYLRVFEEIYNFKKHGYVRFFGDIGKE